MLEQLYHAIKKSEIELILSILDKDNNLIFQLNERNESLILYAIRTGSSLDVINLLIIRGCDVNSKDEFGDTPLIIAATSGNINIAQLLITHFADLDLQDNWGNTALILSILNSHYDISEILIYNNANTQLKNYSGKDALFFLKKYDRKDIIDMIIKRSEE